MDEAQSFVEEIVSQPDDDTPRLVFADWLEERGDPRAEFIRVQCALERADDPAEAARLARRKHELEQRYADEWLEPLRGVGATEIAFRRGFVHSLKLSGEVFVALGDRLFELAPTLRRLKLRSAADWIDTIAGMPQLERLSGLVLRVNFLETRGAVALAQSPHLHGLTMLDLSGNAVGHEGAAALARSESLGRLAVLDLYGNELGSRGVDALVRSPLWPQLVRLELASNRLDDRAAKFLVDAPETRLQWLGLNHNQISESAQDELRRRFEPQAHVGVDFNAPRFIWE